MVEGRLKKHSYAFFCDGKFDTRAILNAEAAPVLFVRFAHLDTKHLLWYDDVR